MGVPLAGNGLQMCISHHALLLQKEKGVTLDQSSSVIIVIESFLQYGSSLN